METVNKKQVKQLFAQEAVFDLNADVVPEAKVIALFGDRAAQFVRHFSDTSKYLRTYDLGDFVITYFTWNGFRVAASFSNLYLLGSDLELISANSKRLEVLS